MAYNNQTKRYTKDAVTAKVGLVNNSSDKTKIDTAFTNVMNALKAEHL